MVGKPLPWNVVDSDGHLLLRQGNIIESAHQAELLRANGLFRELAWDELLDESKPKPQKLSPFDTIAFFHQRLRNLFQDIAAKRCENAVEPVRKLAADIQDVMGLAADAAFGAMHLDLEDSYPVMHSVHVALLTERLAQRLDIAPADRIPIVCAALTANIGMVELQDMLHKQKEPLTARQQEEVWMHPQRAVDLLRSAAVTDAVWLDAVLHHHERVNGSGYPDGLSGNAVSTAVRIISLADMYGAMIKPRAYRPEVLPKDALKLLFMKRGGEIDETIGLLLVKELGIFPPGAFVRLINGEIAVVIKHGKDATHPIVQAVLSPRGGPYSIPKRYQTDNELHQIKETVPRDKTVLLNLNKLWGYE